LSFSIRGFNRDKRIIKEKALTLLLVKAFSGFEIKSRKLEDIDIHHPAKRATHIMSSDAEREAILEALTLGLRDIFRKAKLWRDRLLINQDYEAYLFFDQQFHYINKHKLTDLRRIKRDILLVRINLKLSDYSRRKN
jgi:hypothetical protein